MSEAITTDLAQLTEMVDRLDAINRKIEEAENQLKDLQKQREQLSSIDIPDVFMASGLQELKLDDGRKVNVSKFYSASLSMENPNRKKAIEWLRANNLDAIIKNQVIVGFDKGHDKEALKLVETLAAQGFNPVNVETCHPMTLKSFVKEQLENPDTAEQFPRELFKVYEGKTTKIK